jgi:diketogulonate reductase-like aldo/keto reductase
MSVVDQNFVLSNGVKIPKIGLGTWQVKEGEEVYNAVLTALKQGYRLIDTAQGYGNEEGVGKAVKDSHIPREEIFITTKLEAHIKTYESTKEAFEKSLQRLQLDYVDLFLIHAPWPWNEIGKNCDEGNLRAWKAMEEIYKEGKAKAIGVSNFEPKHIENLLKNTEIPPHVNQIGYFIGIDQSKTIDYCSQKNIFIEAYSPLGMGYLLDNKDIGMTAHKYGKSPAQICIRWCIQKRTTPLPKSVHEKRIWENCQVDFKIIKEDMAFLDTISGDPRK